VDQRETAGKLVVAEPVVTPTGERRLADAVRR
jgi:hypothetical protein